MSDEFGFIGIISVMSCLDSEVMPDAFGGIKFRAVRRQSFQMKATSVLGKPLTNLLRFMIGRVVVNQINFPTGIGLSNMTEKVRVGLSIKNTFSAPMKSRFIKIDRPKDLFCVALACGGDQRLIASSRPGSIQSWILSKTGFVLKNKDLLGFSVFF